MNWPSACRRIRDLVRPQIMSNSWHRYLKYYKLYLTKMNFSRNFYCIEWIIYKKYIKQWNELSVFSERRWSKALPIDQVLTEEFWNLTDYYLRISKDQTKIFSLEVGKFVFILVYMRLTVYSNINLIIGFIHSWIRKAVTV